MHRTHAQRDVLRLDTTAEEASARSITDARRKQLERVFARLRNSENGRYESSLVEQLAEIIEGITVKFAQTAPAAPPLNPPRAPAAAASSSNATAASTEQQPPRTMAGSQHSD